MGKIETLRQETRDEAEKLLRKNGKCAIIRPTGFGKTGILIDFIREYAGKNGGIVLYDFMQSTPSIARKAAHGWG